MVAFKENVSSLINYNELDLIEFLKMLRNIEKNSRKDTESFLESFLKLIKKNVKLLLKVLLLLVEYY